MTRAVSNRLLTDNADFINLESNIHNFRLLLEEAPDGSATSRKDRDNGLSDIRSATSRYE